jgi:hypothetical protein
VCGKNDHVRGRQFLQNHPRSLKAVQDRHLEIHDYNVGPITQGQVDSFLAARSFAIDMVALSLENNSEPVADSALVIGEQNMTWHGVFLEEDGDEETITVPV